jgi:hypothetical protein
MTAGMHRTDRDTLGPFTQETPDALFEQLLDAQAQRKLPPVHQWQPQNEGQIDIRIAANGEWFHEGVLIKRSALVRLFASILRRDGNEYCLVTPTERLLIEVDEVPFTAIDIEVRHQGGPDQALLFTTNVDEHLLADAAHRLWVEDKAGQPRPFIEVRAGLHALLSRSVFYRLVDLGIEHNGNLYVTSSGERFLLGALG